MVYHKHRKIIDKLFVFVQSDRDNPRAPPIPDLIENQFEFYWLQNILCLANESVVPIIEKNKFDFIVVQFTNINRKANRFIWNCEISLIAFELLLKDSFG